MYNPLRAHQVLGGFTPFQATGGGGLTWHIRAQRVKVVGDLELAKVFPGYFSEPSVAEVVPKDKRIFMKRTDYPKRDPGNPMSQKEVEKKFDSIATTVINEERAQKMIELVDILENLENVATLCDLLRSEIRE